MLPLRHPPPAHVLLYFTIMLVLSESGSPPPAPPARTPRAASAATASIPPATGSAARRLHHLLDLIQDGRLYPVLQQDEISSGAAPTYDVTHPHLVPHDDVEHPPVAKLDDVTHPNLAQHDDVEHLPVATLDDDVTHPNLAQHDDVEHPPVTRLDDVTDPNQPQHDDAEQPPVATLDDTTHPLTPKHSQRLVQKKPSLVDINADNVKDLVEGNDIEEEVDEERGEARQRTDESPVDTPPDATLEREAIKDKVTIKKTEQAMKVQSKSNNVDAVNFSASDYERSKRETKQTPNDTTKESVRRVKTGDTILNIRGAVRDSIGDAGAATAARQATRLDTFVIRPSQHERDALPPQPPQPSPRADHAATKVRTLSGGAAELVVEPHSRARLSCDLHNVSGIRWYKDGEAVTVATSASSGDSAWWAAGAGGAGEVEVRAGRGEAGRWRCAGEDRGGVTRSGTPVQLVLFERVRSVYLAVDGRRLDAGNTWVPVREKTLLEVSCVAEGGVPSPELRWRLVGTDPGLDPRLYLRHDVTNHSTEGVSLSRAVVTAARELHNASLQCVAAQPRPAVFPPGGTSATSATSAPSAPGAPAPTAKLEVHVTYPPSFVISRWPGFGVALRAGAAAALRCDVDANPPARAWWQRDGHLPTSSPPPLEYAGEGTEAGGVAGGAGGAGGAATLRWGTLSHAHAGWYRCRATWADTDYSSIGYYLNVISAEEGTEASPGAGGEDRARGEGEQEHGRRQGHGEGHGEGETLEHQKVDVPLGGSVQLHCPKGSVGCWWRRVVGNASAAWAPAGSHHAHGVLGIKDAIYQEGGEYRCVGARAPDLARVRELKRVTVRVGGVGGTGDAAGTEAVQATALSAEAEGGGWRLECGACGRRVRARWLLPTRQWVAAALEPDLAPHCWRAVLHVSAAAAGAGEVWCVVASERGLGAVAVFPARAPPRHAPRALSAASGAPAARAPAAALTAPALAAAALAVLSLPTRCDRG